MKRIRKIMGITLFLSAFSFACRKDDLPGAGELNINNLSAITNVNIPYAIYTGATFTTETTGYAISNSGTIIKTTDAGNNWAALSSPVSFYLDEIQFTDVQTGFIIGGDVSGSYVVKTSNGGVAWTTINLNSQQGGSPTGIYFIDNNKGFVTGPTFFKQTTDGGSTWIDVVPGNNEDFYDVKFSGNTGIATTVAGAYYKTTDGGASWQRHETGSTNQLREVYFAGAEIYIRSGTWLINPRAGKPSVTLPAAVQQLYYLDANRSIGIGQHYDLGFWPYGDIIVTNSNWGSWTGKRYTPEEALRFSAIAKMGGDKFIMLGTGHLKVTVMTIHY